MLEDKVDLTPIDALADPARVEALVAAINELAVPELERRAAGGVLAMLGRWTWPTLAAASLAAAVSAAALLSIKTAPVNGTALAVAGPVVEALQLSEPVALWLDANRGPTTADLVMVLEGEDR